MFVGPFCGKFGPPNSDSKKENFCMPSSVRRVLTLAACCGLIVLWSGAALAQSYSLSYLDSNLTGKAKHVDPLLKNAWGMAYAPGGAFWVSDEASGYSTLY